MSSATTKEMKILMVEDEKYVVDQYRSLTEKHPDFRIVYDTGSEKNALRYLSHHKVDVMILDLELQEGDVLQIEFETEKGELYMEIKAPDGTVVYRGNGKETTEFTLNIRESGVYTVVVEARHAKGTIHVQLAGG